MAYTIDKQSSDAPPENLYNPQEIITPITCLDEVTEDHLNQYAELGFLSIANVFTADQVQQAKQGLADLIMDQQPDFDGVEFESSAAARLEELTLEQRELVVRKLMHFVPWDARLAALAEHDALLALVSRLMAGRKPKLFQDMALLKPPGGREKPWHQDKAYFNIDPSEPVVGLWIALDEATAETGGMHLIPGSHREGPVLHFKRRDWQICDSSVTGKQVAAPLPPGGVLVFDGLIHHGTPPNLSSHRRRALQYHYAPADAVWTDEQARLNIYGEEGKGVTC